MKTFSAQSPTFSCTVSGPTLMSTHIRLPNIPPVTVIFWLLLHPVPCWIYLNTCSYLFDLSDLSLGIVRKGSLAFSTCACACTRYHPAGGRTFQMYRSNLSTLKVISQLSTDRSNFEWMKTGHEETILLKIT